MKLSVVIPAHNESESIIPTVRGLVSKLDEEQIDFELIIVDDASTDDTAGAVERAAPDNARVRCIRSKNPPGFGFAVRSGLDAYEGDAVAIFMADGSDDPGDVVSYHRLLEEGYECAFGSRFVHGSQVSDYPPLKLFLNRLVNGVLRLLFRHGYNDTTNAFKAYRREVIDSVGPFLSPHFNLTVELPLKAVVRGFSYGIVPISWTNREAGHSKLALQEMGSRYLFIILYVLLEHHLSRGDYRRDPGGTSKRRGTWRAGKVHS